MLKNFNSSTLVRLLHRFHSGEKDAGKQDFAERISLWLGGFDAARLHEAHQSIHVMPRVRPSRASCHQAQSLRLELQRLRQGIEQAMVQSNARVLHQGESEALCQVAAGGLPAVGGDASGYAPYRQFYLSQQRLMVARIGPFRARLRQALGESSYTLRQLAALDAAMEQALGAREHSLMGKVPDFLEVRFNDLQRAQVPVPAEASEVWMQELTDALRAELNLRLQPVMGLMDAFSKEANREQ